MFTSSTTRVWSVLIMLQSITTVHAAETDQSSQDWLRVTTDWEPDAALASAAAEAKLRAALTQWLAATRPSCARAATTENLTRLLNLPEAGSRQHQTKQEKTEITSKQNDWLASWEWVSPQLDANRARFELP